MYKPKKQGLINWMFNGVNEDLANDEWVNKLCEMQSILTYEECLEFNNMNFNDNYWYILENFICQHLK